MYRELDLETWQRKDQYLFFKDYDDPFFNITAPVDVTALHAFCKRTGLSFFLCSQFYSLQAVNRVEAFRCRFKGDGVVVYDCIHLGCTVLKDDDNFGFCYFDYTEDLNAFHEEGKQRIEALKRQETLAAREGQDDLIYGSVIPWVSFTSFKHAQSKHLNRAVPRIVFGKYYREGERLRMPVSVEVNHSLMDGLHVGRYFETLQVLLDASNGGG